MKIRINMKRKMKNTIINRSKFVFNCIVCVCVCVYLFMYYLSVEYDTGNMANIFYMCVCNVYVKLSDFLL